MHSIEVHEKYTKTFYKEGNEYRLECTHEGNTWRQAIPEFTLRGPGIEGLDDKYHQHTQYLIDGPFVRIYPTSMEIVGDNGRVESLSDTTITLDKVKLLAAARWNQEMLIERVNKTGLLKEFILECVQLGDARLISDKWFYGDKQRTYRQADLIKWYDWFRVLLANPEQLPDLPVWADAHFPAALQETSPVFKLLGALHGKPNSL